MLKMRNILTVHFLLYESQLAGGAVRRESYGVEVLLSHLLQKLQTVRLAAAPVSRSARAFLCHFHCEKRADDDAPLYRFSLRSLLVSRRRLQRAVSCAWDWLRCFFFSYYSGFYAWHKRSVSTCEAKVAGVTNRRFIRQPIASCIS